MTTARAGEIGDAYPGFAKFMGDNVSSGMAIFDRLPVLNARNLLYMQAELLHLDCQLRAQTEYDHRSLDLTAQSYERNVLNMMQSNCPQWQLILEIRSRLKDYNDALLRQAALSQLKKPSEHEFDIVKYWLLNPEGGNQFLNGLEAQPWKSRDSLVSIVGSSSKDQFTLWMELKLFPWLYRRLVQRKKKLPGIPGHAGLVHYDEKVFGIIARIANIILSILTPSVAMIGLYFIKSLAARLVAVIGFSTLFSLVLAVFTRARPIEIFTATSAFAAVQVVFVGSATTTRSVT